MLIPFWVNAPAILCPISEAISPVYDSPLPAESITFLAALLFVIPSILLATISAPFNGTLTASDTSLGEYLIPPGVPPAIEPTRAASPAPSVRSRSGSY